MRVGLILYILKVIGLHIIFIAIMTAISTLSSILGGAILHLSTPATNALIGAVGASVIWFPAPIISSIVFILFFGKRGISSTCRSDPRERWSRFTTKQIAAVIILETANLILLNAYSAAIGYRVLQDWGYSMEESLRDVINDVGYMGALGCWSLLGVGVLLLWPVGLCYILTDEEFLRRCFGLEKRDVEAQK
ncbi:hypothetical protein BDQ17DRAFT_1544755 [Cyathus striatus]|nr:hypothetical protein BDQ17DRAFT_1544755 [Cyathus striatus]